MGAKLLAGKQILAVDDEQDILDIIAEELEEHGVELDRASSYEDAIQKMSSLTYDMVILDIMGVRGFELLEFATNRRMPAIMLTAHALSPESLKKSIELGARAFLPKDQLGQLTPFLEDVLTQSYHGAWKSVLGKLGGSFGKRFGPDWTKTEKEFWEQFQKDLEINQGTIIRS
jgi:DNA-binding response OmpR family regulator